MSENQKGLDKKTLLKLGLPIKIYSGDAAATIELNSSEFVVVRYGSDDSAYLNDARLDGWEILNPVKRLLYKIASI